MSTLPELVAEKNELMRKIEETGGELSGSVEAWLTEVEKNLVAKVDSYHFIEMAIASEVAFYKEQEEKFKHAAKMRENILKRLKDRVKEVMKKNLFDDLAGELYRYNLSTRAPKLVIDESQLPKEYMQQTIVFTPDRDKIMEDIMLMKAVPGCSFEKVYALTASVINKGNRS